MSFLLFNTIVDNASSHVLVGFTIIPTNNLNKSIVWGPEANDIDVMGTILVRRNETLSGEGVVRVIHIVSFLPVVPIGQDYYIS